MTLKSIRYEHRIEQRIRNLLYNVIGHQWSIVVVARGVAEFPGIFEPTSSPNCFSGSWRKPELLFFKITWSQGSQGGVQVTVMDWT